MQWFKKTIPWNGAVFFRGSLQPRASDFEYLGKQGIRVTPASTGSGVLWRLELAHPDWGKAVLECPPEPDKIPSAVVDYDPRLSDAEKQAALQGEAFVHLSMQSSKGHILRDRKLALRFIRAVMSDDAVIGLDCLGMRPWSQTALDEELVHDADLDIDDIYCLHLVRLDEEDESVWLHSHGLAEIGAFDYDILRPSRDIRGGAANDVLRMIAYAILEGAADVSTPLLQIAHPGGFVRFVEVSKFNHSADPADVALRDGGTDASHNGRRAVLCEPVRGFFSFLSRKVKPSRFLSEPMPEHGACAFSSQATELMTERARNTYPVFRQLIEEFAEFEFPILVKLGYEQDSGGPNDREHLWFSVNRCLDDRIEATLENTPFNIARMKAGDRAEHPIDRLTEWSIMTPAGVITARSMVGARKVRENREKLLAMMAEYRRQSSES